VVKRWENCHFRHVSSAQYREQLLYILTSKCIRHRHLMSCLLCKFINANQFISVCLEESRKEIHGKFGRLLQTATSKHHPSHKYGHFTQNVQSHISSWTIRHLKPFGCERNINLENTWNNQGSSEDDNLLMTTNTFTFTFWPLWSSGKSSWLQIQRYRVWFHVLPDFLRSSGYGMGSTQPHEDNWGAIWKKQ
jgi:hypothetical protein